jgi:hypothetical protein
VLFKRSIRIIPGLFVFICLSVITLQSHVNLYLFDSSILSGTYLKFGSFLLLIEFDVLVLDVRL